MTTGTELIVRGLIDKLIEDQLDYSVLGKTHQLFESLKTFGAIRVDRRDAVFGYIMGAVQSRFGNHFNEIYNRYPNIEEVAIAIDVFQKRMLQIRSRIDETFT